MKKDRTQSIAVSPEEKLMIDVLAAAKRVKPATLSRHLFFRGLYEFLQDDEIHAPMLETEIYDEVEKRIGEDSRLSHLKSVLESNHLASLQSSSKSVLEISEPLMSVGTHKKLNKSQARTVKKDVVEVTRDAERREQEKRHKQKQK